MIKVHFDRLGGEKKFLCFEDEFVMNCFIAEELIKVCDEIPGGYVDYDTEGIIYTSSVYDDSVVYIIYRDDMANINFDQIDAYASEVVPNYESVNKSEESVYSTL